MKKRDFKRIKRFLDSIEWMFELNNFERTIVDKEYQPENEANLSAEITIETTYREIIINLYPHFWALSQDLQRFALLHELVHTLLVDSKLLSTDLIDGRFHSNEEIKTVNEQTTTKITHLLDYLFRNKLKYAKKAYKDYLGKGKKK